MDVYECKSEVCLWTLLENSGRWCVGCSVQVIARADVVTDELGQRCGILELDEGIIIGFNFSRLPRR